MKWRTICWQRDYYDIDLEEEWNEINDEESIFTSSNTTSKSGQRYKSNKKKRGIVRIQNKNRVWNSSTKS